MLFLTISSASFAVPQVNSKQSIEFGYRFTDINGSQQTYAAL
jgi:hypothetical protein